MASLMPNGKQQFFTAAGAPLVGGKVYTYAAGTNTPKNTFSDSAGTVPNTNPIILDARGEALIYWLGSYKVALQDSIGNAVYTVDNYNTTTELSSANGASLIGGGTQIVTSMTGLRALLKTSASTNALATGYYASGDGGSGQYYLDAADTTSPDNGSSIIVAADGGRWKLILTGIINIKQGGAKVDGVTDDSAAIAAMLLVFNRITFPEGTCKASFDLVTGQTVTGSTFSKSKLILPAGKTFCIRIDASVTAKQFTRITDLAIDNPNAVANCVGILYNSLTVNNVNDYHVLERLVVTNFDRGIEILGRWIWGRMLDVETSLNRIGLNVATDSSTQAFNQNIFDSCRFNLSKAQGARLVGPSLCNTFINTNIQQNNSLNVVSVAGLEVQDSSEFSLLGCDFEANGSGVAVDATTPGNNSVAVLFNGGSISVNPVIKSCNITGSGCGVLMNAAQINSGKAEQNTIFALGGGFAFAYNSAQTQNQNQNWFRLSDNNVITGQVKFLQDINGNYGAVVEQSNAGAYYMATPQILDLLKVSSIVANPTGSAIGIVVINNRLPGTRLTIYNNSAALNVTVDPILMDSGLISTIGPKATKRYMALGFPNPGKLVEI